MQSKPRRKKQSHLFDPARIFIAVLIVAVIFFLPIVSPGNENRDSFTEKHPALNPLASSADACPFSRFRDRTFCHRLDNFPTGCDHSTDQRKHQRFTRGFGLVRHPNLCFRLSL